LLLEAVLDIRAARVVPHRFGWYFVAVDQTAKAVHRFTAANARA